ncbi:MAG TPA: hypothetical protein DIW31_06385 [Bacteroidales bacterium]|nr:hypothetical protein [Bacteroidales bacterium]
MYRKSYASFDQILKTQGSYKDAKELRDEALAKGMITITLGSIENKTRIDGINSIVESKVKSAVNGLNNPFIKIIDKQNTNQLIEEQQRGVNQGSDIQVGKILAAKALFTGAIMKFSIDAGKLKKQDKRGYLKEEYIVKDPTTGESKKKYKYSKVAYTEYTQENNVTSSFQYQLTSTETSAILVSDAMDVNAVDYIHYVAFDGKANQLVPGWWEHFDKDSPKDKINDNSNDIDNLRDLIKASRSIKSIDALKTEVYNGIASRVARKINAYNPEE